MGKTNKNGFHKCPIKKEKGRGNTKSLTIKGGLFFKEDFAKLPKGVVIYIKNGLIILTK